MSGPRKPPKGARSIHIDPELLATLEALPNLPKPWSEEEDEILLYFYREKGPAALAPLFKEKFKRSTVAMQKQAARLGLTGRLPDNAP